jgi:hypothetical protein
MERISMTNIQSALIAAALAMGMAAPVSAAQTDPEVIIYRFPGVVDDGSPVGAGVATAFHCTNFSGVTETLRIVVRQANTVIRANFDVQVFHLATVTLSTHGTVLYNDGILNTNIVNQGTAAIAATSTNIICTAVTLDASSAVPNGFALRGIRFNPIPGSQE